MKEVLISIKPKWCELIASGKKTVEVRKTKPKLETPFKVYIYETLGKTKWCNTCKDPCERPYPNCACHEGWGKVIGEFVCDKIVKFENSLFDEALRETVARSCVPMYDLLVYIGKQDYGYGWHIRDLVIYDKSRELSEFYQKGKNDANYYCDYCGGCVHHETPVNEHPCNECDGNRNYLCRPPQSWCYVENAEPRQMAD